MISLRTHDLAAERLADRLMAQADAENRHLPASLLDDFQRHAGLVRRARPGRDHDALRRQLANLLDRQLVVARDAHVLTQLAEVLHEVVGEAVVVVDHQ